MKKVLAAAILATSLISAGKVHAQSQLGAGDLLFVQLSSDTPDTFAFTFTKNIQAGTQIIFTDNAWDSGDFWRVVPGGSAFGRMTENSFVWTAGTDLSAGAITTISSHNLALATSGDNLFAFQGSWIAPQFVSGALWDQASSWITTGAADTNNSYLPSTLTNGSSAFSRGATGDNTGYTGALTNDTTANLRNAIYGTPANWTTNNSSLVSPTAGPYTFTDATDAASQVNTIAFYNFGEAAASYTAGATKVNGQNGNKATFSSFSNAQVVSGGSLDLDADGKDGFNNQGYSTENTSTAFGTTPTLDLSGDAAFQFSLTIDSGYIYDLKNVSFFGLRNDNGPQSLALYYSLDSGSSWLQIGSNLSLSSTDWASFSFVDSGDLLNGWTNTVDFRIYAWNAASATGQQFRLDEMYVEGIVAVPEPSTALSIALGGGLLAFRRRKRA